MTNGLSTTSQEKSMIQVLPSSMAGYILFRNIRMIQHQLSQFLAKHLWNIQPSIDRTTSILIGSKYTKENEGSKIYIFRENILENEPYCVNSEHLKTSKITFMNRLGWNTGYFTNDLWFKAVFLLGLSKHHFVADTGSSTSYLPPLFSALKLNLSPENPLEYSTVKLRPQFSDHWYSYENGEVKKVSKEEMNEYIDDRQADDETLLQKLDEKLGYGKRGLMMDLFHPKDESFLSTTYGAVLPEDSNTSQLMERLGHAVLGLEFLNQFVTIITGGNCWRRKNEYVDVSTMFLFEKNESEVQEQEEQEEEDDDDDRKLSFLDLILRNMK